MFVAWKYTTMLKEIVDEFNQALFHLLQNVYQSIYYVQINLLIQNAS